MTHCSMQHIPLSSAYLCQDCNSIGNCAQQCPACASAVLLSLSGVLDRDIAIEEPRMLVRSFPRAVVEFDTLVA